MGDASLVYLRWKEWVIKMGPEMRGVSGYEDSRGGVARLRGRGLGAAPTFPIQVSYMAPTFLGAPLSMWSKFVVVCVLNC